MEMRIATHQLSAIRASLVAAMEQLDGLSMVLEAVSDQQPAPAPAQEQEPPAASAARPTFGRAKEPAAQSGDR